MNKLLFPAFLTGLSLFILFCKNKEAVPAKSNPFKAESSQYSKRQCLDESKGLCAEFKIAYPIFSGGDSATVVALNKSVQEYVLTAVGGNTQLPFVQALDSAGWSFIQLFTEDQKERPGVEMGYTTEIRDSVPLLNAKVATIQMDGYSFTGGAHPNPFGLLTSFDLTKGAKPIELTDLVRDTNALRPILEKAYKIGKGLKETDPLTEVVYPEITQMPMPANVGVVAEGVRFYFNAYEIAPYAVGPADVLLTWDQLGALADRKLWGQ